MKKATLMIRKLGWITALLVMAAVGSELLNCGNLNSYAEAPGDENFQDDAADFNAGGTDGSGGTYTAHIAIPRTIGDWRYSLLYSDGSDHVNNDTSSGAYIDIATNYNNTCNALAVGEDISLSANGYYGEDAALQIKSESGDEFKLVSFKAENFMASSSSYKVKGYKDGVYMDVYKDFSAPGGSAMNVQLTDAKWGNIDEFRIVQQDASLDVSLFIDDIDVENPVLPNNAPVKSGGDKILIGDEDSIKDIGSAAEIAASNGMSDSDGDVLGLAVTGTFGRLGNWQYSADGGTSWDNIGVVSDSASLLLSETARIRYVPDAKNGEPSDIKLRAWDKTSGTASSVSGRGIADTSTNGGSTAFSTNILTLNVVVQPVNDAPVLDMSALPAGPFATISAAETNHAGVAVSAICGGAITDVDNGSTLGIALTGAQNTVGKWQYNTGSEWQDVGEVSEISALLLRSTDKLRFVPSGS